MIGAGVTLAAGADSALATTGGGPFNAPGGGGGGGGAGRVSSV